MHIFLRDDVDVRPCRILTSRQVPVHMKVEADKLIKELLISGVIVKVDGPTDWISPGHFVPKPDGRVRLVTDYTRLNLMVKRPVHPFPSSIDLMKRVDPASKFFCKLDAVHGYFQIPLDEESSYLTTFLLPSGKYRYTCAPMGLCSSSDEFCCRTDEPFVGLPWLMKIVDDMLIQAPTMDILRERVRTVFEKCRGAGIRISNRKMEVGRKVKFAGFMVSSDGVIPDPKKVQAISGFPSPKNVTELKSFLGLVNQLGIFAPNLAHQAATLRGLLKKNVAWQWLQEHQAEFDKIKLAMCSDVLVKPFDPSLPTELLTDASRLHGIGYALIQRGSDGKVRLINCNSRSLTSAQRNYAVIELECMAISWAVEKCQYYLRGISDFTVVTDHRPLVGIFAKSLQDLDNKRLTRYREKLVDYSFKVTWCPGKDHLIADALSRAPVWPGEPEPEEIILRAVSVDPALTFMFEAAREDQHYQELVFALKAGMKPSSVFLSPYVGVWESLSILTKEKEASLVVFDGFRIVVPQSIRGEILRRLHAPHQGMTKTYENARQLYYWAGMKNDIRIKTEQCELCQKYIKSQQRETLKQTAAEFPMHMVGTDLFYTHGQHWLLMVDRFSGYPFAERLTDLSTVGVTTILMSWFHDWGLPQYIRSDGGPQF